MVKKNAFTFLQYTLGFVFIWFGFLKLFGVSPVTSMIEKSMPPFIFNIPYFMLMLSLGEIVIGILLLTKRFLKIGAVLMIAHLIIASLSVLITQGFSPYFPYLTLEGEFVAKNAVLIACGIVLYSKDDI